jgi:hypothetical protein
MLSEITDIHLFGASATDYGNKRVLFVIVTGLQLIFPGISRHQFNLYDIIVATLTLYR